MAKTSRQSVSIAVSLVLAGVLSPAAVDAQAAAPASRTEATSLGFAGWRAKLAPITITRTVVQVAATGRCGDDDTSVAVGAEQRGAAGMLGAAIYSHCIGGSIDYLPSFETASGPVEMTSIGSVGVGDTVLIVISTAGGLTTVKAFGRGGYDSMIVPDILATDYRVGLWPKFFTTEPSTMPNFGTVRFEANDVNDLPLADVANKRVHLADASDALRAKSGPIGGGGKTFKVKWIAP
jgi:hypothetical protein